MHDGVHWLSVMTIHIPTPSSESNDDVLRLMLCMLWAHVAHGGLWGQDFLSNCLPASSKDWTSLVTQIRTVWGGVHWLSVMTIHIPTPSSELNDDTLRLML